MDINKIINGNSLDVLKTLPDNSIDCCITSPPYWGLRDYGHEEQLGSEKHFKDFVINLCNVFDEVKRVLKPSGTCFVNLGDTFSSDTKGTGGPSDKQLSNKGSRYEAKKFDTEIPNKCLCLVPERFAIEMIDRGWTIRNQIIWHKPNPMPESVTDRCTKAHEYIFLLSKSNRYYFDSDAIKEPATTENGRARQFGASNQEGTMRNDEGRIFNDNGFRNKRDVWTIPVKPYQGAHFATFPPDLITPCILAGSPVGGTVLDPFFGAGTTGLVAQQYNRKWIGCELNSTYAQIAIDRIADGRTLFTI